MRTQVPLSELRGSDANVRHSKTEIATLAASIRSIGLLQPLVVTAVDGGYEVVAGKRRLAALQELAGEGKLSEAEPIDVLILAEGNDLTEASLAENIIREDMTVADEVRAFKAMTDQGADADDIGRRFGYSRKIVLQRLALANLEKSVFAAFEKGLISLEIAKAFTVNPDHKRQRKVLKECMEHGQFYGHAYSIKQSLMDEAIQGSDKRARLVGQAAFEEAGGTVHTDLFGEEEAGFWTPGQLLHDLAEARMVTEAEDLRKRHKLGFVLPIMESYIPYDYAGVFRAPGGERPKKKDLGEAQVGRFLMLNNDGTMELAPAFYTDRKLRTDGTGKVTVEPVAEKPADTVSDKARRALTEQRRDVLRVNLMRRPKLAQAVMIFCLADKMVRNGGYGSTTGSNLSTTSSYGGADSGHEPNATLAAAVEFDQQVETLERNWTQAETPAARLDAFLELTGTEQQKWAAVALCASLKATGPADGRTEGGAFHNHLGQKLEIDVRKDWTPTIDSYFGFLSKGQLLALLGTVDEDLAKDAAKQKAGEVKALCETEAKHGKLATFVPDQLTFPAAEPEEPVTVEDEIDAATPGVEEPQIEETIAA